MRLGHNFWLDGPIDPRSTRLNCNVQNLFRDSQLDHIGSPKYTRKIPHFHIWLYFACIRSAKYGRVEYPWKDHAKGAGLLMKFVFLFYQASLLQNMCFQGSIAIFAWPEHCVCPITLQICCMISSYALSVLRCYVGREGNTCSSGAAPGISINPSGQFIIIIIIIILTIYNSFAYWCYHSQFQVETLKYYFADVPINP